MKALVAYFTASGVTKRAAEVLADTVNGDLFEIIPEQLYTAEDLDYRNKESRSTVEMSSLDTRPAVKEKVSDLSAYDTVYIGFPVWWGREPSVVDTFLDENDLSGKKVVVFCTSGSSPVDGSVKRIAELTKGTVCGGFRLSADPAREEAETAVKNLLG